MKKILSILFFISFVFQIFPQNKDSKIKFIKGNIVDKTKAIKICRDEEDALFKVGQSIGFFVLFEGENADILVKKEDKSTTGTCSQSSYEYDGKVCESKIFNNEDFGFNRIQIESPFYEDGVIVTKGKKNAPVADASKRDFENVPLVEDIDMYFEREVKPYNAEAWIDKSKTKVGYEIPFTRVFYKFDAPEQSEDIEKRLSVLESDIMASLTKLFKEA